MKTPLAMSLLVPMMLVSIFTSQYFERDYLNLLVIPIFIGLILIEIRLRKGAIDLETIYSFLNTPIKPKGLFGSEPTLDNSPRVSLLKGIFIILGGAIVVITVLIFVFGFILV